MSNRKCRQAIETAINTWNSAKAKPYPIAWENAPFTPPEAVYLRCHMLPAQTDSNDLKGDHRCYRGVYQISIYAPINQGSGGAEAIADELAALFPNNKRLTAGGLSLQTVSPVSVARGMQDEGRYILPCSFYYRADVI